MNVLRLSTGITIIVLLSLVSCSHPLKNSVGSTVMPVQRLTFTAGSEQAWETNHLILHYTVEEHDNRFAITGTVSVKDWVRNSYPVAKFLDVYVILLDSNGIATSIQDLSLLLPAYSQFKNKLTFRKQLPEDSDFSSIAFSYWGVFRQGGLLHDDGEELDIYHNPFQK